MSEENVEVIHRANDAFSRGDKAAWLETFDPDVVMIPARDWPETAPTRGREALWDFYTGVTATWEGGSYEVGDVIDSGKNQVVANARYEGRGRASGAGFEFDYWFVGTYRDGRTVRIEWFSNRDEALEAAGLSE